MADVLAARQGDHAVPSFLSSILASQSAAAESAASIASELSASFASATSDTFGSTATDDAITTSLPLSSSTTAALTASTTTPTDKATLEGVSPIVTPTSSATTAGNEASSATNTTLPPLTSASETTNKPSLSHGALAAAIILPILFGSLALFLLYAYLRNRHRRNLNDQHTRMVSSAGADGFEKGAAETRTSLQPLAPVLASTERNSAYFTGLDTAATPEGSRQQSAEYYPTHSHPRLDSDASTIMSEPPPPYKSPSIRTSASAMDPLAAALSPTRPSARERTPSYVLPEIPSITREEGSSSPFTDAAALPASGSNNALRPTTSRTNTARSFSSTLYSDDASLHSARAHRVSVGAVPMPVVMDPGSGSAGVSPLERREDPFGDALGRAGSGRSGVSELRSWER